MTQQLKSALMARLRASRRREGWTRIEVWVPAELVKQVRDYVKRITKRAAQKERT